MVEKVKIVFCGGRQLGVDTLEWLCSNYMFNVVAVCPLTKDFDNENYDKIQNIIKKYNIQCCFDINDLENIQFDIGLSVNYNKILSEKILNLCKIGFYNVHHSYNLRLRGRNITTHAILNARKENIFYHGTTLHLMVPKLDAGGIVASASCNIDENDTANTLFKKVDNLAFDLIKEWLPRIATQNIILYEAPMLNVHYYTNADLPSKEIKKSLSEEETFDFVRAFDFPPFEPAYIMLNNNKVHLVIKKRDVYIKEMHYKDRTYYTDSDF